MINLYTTHMINNQTAQEEKIMENKKGFNPDAPFKWMFKGVR